MAGRIKSGCSRWSAKKQGVLLEDALSFLPPTRQYTEPEIRQAMAAHGIDGVLVITLTGDTGAQQQYAGTVTTGNATAVGTTMYGGNDLGLGFGNERIDAGLSFQSRHSVRSAAFRPADQP
jgi:hypothetical protein